jgi:hypothetical protein
MVRRFCRANGLCFLWTLTYRVPATSRKEVARDVNRLFTRLAQAYGKLPVVAVIERGTNATRRLHVHLGVDRWLNIDLVADAWRKGFVWVGDGRKCPGQPGVKRLSKYLSKYVAKQYEKESDQEGEREFRAHRYQVTQGFSVPQIRRQCASSQAGAEMLRHMYGPPSSVVFFDYRAEGGVYGYWLEFPDSALWPPEWIGDT